MKSPLGWRTHGNLRVNSGNLILSALPSSGPGLLFFCRSSEISLPPSTIYSLLHSLLLGLQERPVEWPSGQHCLVGGQLIMYVDLGLGTWEVAFLSRGCQSGWRSPTFPEERWRQAQVWIPYWRPRGQIHGTGSRVQWYQLSDSWF